MIQWPDDVGVGPGLVDHFADLADSVYNGAGLYPRRLGLEEYNSGASRVVYDISAHTGIPAVLKVPYTKDGLNENRVEIHERTRWGASLQNRLVPVTGHGHGGYWAVLPKVETELSAEEMDVAYTELTRLVEQAHGATREVYEDNIGVYRDTFVLVDHGGLIPHL